MDRFYTCCSYFIKFQGSWQFNRHFPAKFSNNCRIWRLCGLSRSRYEVITKIVSPHLFHHHITRQELQNKQYLIVIFSEIIILGIINNYLNCFWFNVRCRSDRLTMGVPQPFKHRCFSSQLLPLSEQYFPLPDGGGSMQRLIRFLIHLFVPSFIVQADHSPHVPQLPSIQNRMKHW